MDLTIALHPRSFVSIDGSGGFIIPPNVFTDKDGGKFKKSTTIFLYNGISFLGNKIFPLHQAFLGEHTRLALYDYFEAWIESGGAIPRIVVVDGSAALIDAVSMSFNNMCYKKYLELSFKYLLGENDKLPPCLIKRDRAHLIKNMCHHKAFGKHNALKKDFYVTNVAFALQIDDLKFFNQFVEAIFIVLLSEFCEENSECDQRLNWLFENVGTFNYKNHYELKVSNLNEESTKDETRNNVDIEDEIIDCDHVVGYIQNICNNINPYLDIESEKSFKPNSYYLPELLSYLIKLFSLFVSWTDCLNRFYEAPDDIAATSARSECYYRIMKKDLDMNTPLSVNRVTLKHLQVIDGATKLGRAAMNKFINNESLSNCAQVEDVKHIIPYSKTTKDKNKHCNQQVSNDLKPESIKSLNIEHLVENNHQTKRKMLVENNVFGPNHGVEQLLMSENTGNKYKNVVQHPDVIINGFIEKQ